jgi:nucleotide-binding universal stress UspA family protein
VGHLAGSVAAQVAAHAHCPVIVTRPTSYAELDPATFADHPVVVGLDSSPESDHAMDLAVEQAVARGTKLHAVYAWNVLEVHDIGPIVADRFVNADEEAKALRLLTEATEGWTDRYPDLRIVRQVIHSVDPVDALTHASRRRSDRGRITRPRRIPGPAPRLHRRRIDPSRERPGCRRARLRRRPLSRATPTCDLRHREP